MQFLAEQFSERLIKKPCSRDLEHKELPTD